MFDKSKDYLKQTVHTTVFYLLKAEETSRAYATDSLQVFLQSAKAVAYAVKQSSTRSSSDSMQDDTCTIYLWREPWLAVFSADRLPVMSDKLYAGDAFWLVAGVEYTDLDDSGQYQRYKLSCDRSKRKAAA